MAIAFWMLFWAVATGLVAGSRGGSGGLWGITGAVLGPLGFALAFTAGTPCPACRSRIHHQATRCPKCQVEIAHGPVEAPKPAVASCGKCGQPLGDARWRCPACKAIFA